MVVQSDSVGPNSYALSIPSFGAPTNAAHWIGIAIDLLLIYLLAWPLKIFFGLLLLGMVASLVLRRTGSWNWDVTVSDEGVGLGMGSWKRFVVPYANIESVELFEKKPGLFNRFMMRLMATQIPGFTGNPYVAVHMKRRVLRLFIAPFPVLAWGKKVALPVWDAQGLLDEIQTHLQLGDDAR